MLNVEGLETAYGVSQVLFGVSFAVEAGQVVTLLGRNGMGKTTTVLSVMGVVRSSRGSIAFEGKPLHGLPSFRVAQAGIGLVPEGRQIFPNLTVCENLDRHCGEPPRRGDAAGRSNGCSTFSAVSRRGSATTATSSPAASSRCSRSAAR